jgi:hypothetical protein
MIKENELPKIIARFNFLNDSQFPPSDRDLYMQTAIKKGYEAGEHFLFGVCLNLYLNSVPLEDAEADLQRPSGEIDRKIEEMFGIKFYA